LVREGGGVKSLPLKNSRPVRGKLLAGFKTVKTGMVSNKKNTGNGNSATDSNSNGKNYGVKLVNYGVKFVNYDIKFVNYDSKFVNYGSKFVNYGSKFVNYGSKFVNYGS
jgi:hypothetical protein